MGIQTWGHFGAILEVFGFLWGVQGVGLGVILGALGVLWVVQGVPLGVILGVLGYLWEPLARSRLQGRPPQISGAPF